MDLTDGPDPLDALLAEFPAAAAALAESAAEAPPPALRSRTLAAALAARPAGNPARAVEAVSPAEAFARAVDDLVGLLEGFEPGDWNTPALDSWTVLGVVGHLAAVEQYIGARLELWPMPEEFGDDADHRRMTEGSVTSAEAGDASDALTLWRERAAAVVARARELDDDQLEERVMVHGFSYRWRTLLVARTFEVWTHASDIRSATRRARVDPEAAQLRLMSEVAVAALPVGLALSGGTAAGRSARIVLTGAGGGAWTQPLEVGADARSGDGDDPAVTLVVDAVDFCRVAAQRLSPADLDAVIEGDRALAQDLLVGVAVFAA